MRTNPATSLFNVASQASSGISSFVPSLGTRSTSPMNNPNSGPHPSNTNSFPSSSQHELKVTNSHENEDYDMTEALLAIALLESQTPQKSGDVQSHSHPATTNHDFDLTTKSNQPVPYFTTEETTINETPVQHALPDDDLERPNTAREIERTIPVPEKIQESRPIYAQPCATDDFLALPATPEELQAIEDATNRRSSSTRNAETSQDGSISKKGNAQCDCVSSRLFPHRANKCTFRNLTGAAPTEESRSSGADVSVGSPLSSGVGNGRSTSPLRQHSNSGISSEQVWRTSFSSALLFHTNC